jgi:uncharacterized protein
MGSAQRSWQMTLPVAAAIWAAVVIVAALYGVSMGFGGRTFAVGLGVAAVLFAFELFLASPAVLGNISRSWGRFGVPVIVLLPLLAVLVYSLGVTNRWHLTLISAAYAVLPILLGALSKGKPGGTWEDYAAIFIIWLPVEFRWMYRVFVYPSAAGMGTWPLTHTLTILFALGTGVAAFVLVRQLDGIGYCVEWRRGDLLSIVAHFAIFALIAVPLGLKMHFLTYDPSASRLKSLPLSAMGILFFTAWPEEFLFRGLLQNALSRTTQSRWTGLIIAAVIFGFSHILHAPFPNWKYVALATIAGIFYGHIWMESESLLPSTIVHALVDISWHILFR